MASKTRSNDVSDWGVLTSCSDLPNIPPLKRSYDMGRGDNRRTLKMKRRKSQSKLKARIKKVATAVKAAKKPAPSKKK